MLQHVLHDGRFGFGGKLSGKLFRQVILGINAAGADDLHEELFGIDQFQSILSAGRKGQLGIVIGIVDGHPVDGPVDVVRLHFINEPHFGRKGVFTAEGDSEEGSQNGQVFGIEGVLPRPELTHDLPFGEEQRFLRLLNDQLRVSAQIRMRESPGKRGVALLRRPPYKINNCHTKDDLSAQR